MQIRSVLVFWLIILLVALFQAPTAIAQVPLANPNIQLTADGVIVAEAQAPDGSVVIGGTFSSIDGVARQNIARLKPDGTLDANWNPGANAGVYAIAIDSTSSIFVSGVFGQIGGQPRFCMGKLSPIDGSADAQWNPAPDSCYFGAGTIAVDNGGSVYVANAFTNIGGQARNGLAKLSTTGTGAADPTWNPNPTGSGYSQVNALALDSSGELYVAGYFSSIGGQSRNNVAKLSTTGAGAADPTWNPNADYSPKTLVFDGAGALYVGGNFRSIGGQTRSFLAKLSTTGTGAADTTWNPNPDSTVTALALDGSGALYVGGDFASIGGQSRNSLAKLSATGTGAADASWNPGTLTSSSESGNYYAAPVSALNLSIPNTVLVGGAFSSIGGQSHLGLAALSTSDGVALSTDYDALRQPTVYAIAAEPGGGMIVGGDFNSANALPRNSLLRLQADGSLDTVWNPGADGAVSQIAINAATSAIYVAGSFITIGGLYEYGLAKIAGNGVVDPTWTPAPDCEPVTAVTLDACGNVYVGGCFGSIGGLSRANIAKLSGSTGAADATWNPSVDYGPSGLAVDNTNGWLYAFGYFQNAGGGAHKYLARFSTSGAGAVDANWNPNPDSPMNSIAIDTDGSVFVGGYFQNIGGQARSNIAKLTGANGSADATWNPTACLPYSLTLDGSGALYANGCALSKLSTTGTGVDPIYASWNPGSIDGNVLATALDASGNVYVGGSFSTIGSTARTALAALPPTAPPIPSTERSVLVALYNDTTGANWTNHTNWLGAVGTECTWFGVTCANSHVTQISLDSNNLVGTLPAITDLTQLTIFDAQSNPQLTGSIPALSGLNNLWFFRLDSDNMTGSIPTLSGTPSLGVFDVARNQLTGSIPPLTGLSNLGFFGVFNNQLTGSIPSLTGLSTLGGFYADNNQLSGQIPDLSGLTSLTNFTISDNRISGNVPAAPPSLTAGGSSLCPNPLTQTPAPAWDTATGVTPWYSGCTDEIFGNGFE